MRMSSVISLDEMRAAGIDGELCDRGLSAYPDGELRCFGDDFCSDWERRKFASLPPIEPADIAQADMDQLLRDLSSH